MYFPSTIDSRDGRMNRKCAPARCVCIICFDAKTKSRQSVKASTVGLEDPCANKTELLFWEKIKVKGKQSNPQDSTATETVLKSK